MIWFLSGMCLAIGGALGFWMGRQGARLEAVRVIATSAAENKMLAERIATHQQEFTALQTQFATQFENLAGRIFQEQSAHFQQSSQQQLGVLLDPLKEKISAFEKKVADTYTAESRERFALKQEIARIVEVNQRMTFETTNLTRALRGDVKAQGNWGEMMLDRLLAASGLRAGEEYTKQGKDLALTDSDGRRLQPDVIVNLPDAKHIIVDSKVSLTHYDRYIAATDEAQKAAHLRAFLDSMYAHINGLSAKNYPQLSALDTPEFVLMFVPIEGAFSLAIQSDEQLFTRAWDKSVVLVSPTTLFVSLRTIASLWKQERQTRNAIEIALQGGRLYDKFVTFVTDLEKIGEHITRTQSVYTESMNKLKDGRGNLIARVEKLKTLGANTTKTLPAQWLPEEETAVESITAN